MQTQRNSLLHNRQITDSTDGYFVQVYKMQKNCMCVGGDDGVRNSYQQNNYFIKERVTQTGMYIHKFSNTHTFASELEVSH